MGKKLAGFAVGGSLIGGLLGGGSGVCLGALIGGWKLIHPDPPRHEITDYAEPVIGFVGLILGAVIGGIVCAVGGAMLGAGLAVKFGSKAVSLSSKEGDAAPPQGTDLEV